MLVDELVGFGVVRASVRERLMRERQAESVMCIVDVFCSRGWFEFLKKKRHVNKKKDGAVALEIYLLSWLKYLCPFRAV